MPLTLRPTGLSRDPKANDWCIHDGGPQPVGRIYEDQAAPVEGSRWAWFLQIVGASRVGVPMAGRAASLDEAKAAFRASYEGWQAWSVTGAWKHKTDDAVSAQIIRWDGGRVGVSYTFADGAREARGRVLRLASHPQAQGCGQAHLCGRRGARRDGGDRAARARPMINTCELVHTAMSLFMLPFVVGAGRAAQRRHSDTPTGAEHVQSNRLEAVINRSTNNIGGSCLR